MCSSDLDVSRFETEFIEHLKASRKEILEDIKTTQKLTDENDQALVAAVADFKKGFATSDGSSVIPDAEVPAMDESELDKESVQVRKPAPKK